MKKFFAILLAVAMVASLAACTDNSNTENQSAESQSAESQSSESQSVESQSTESQSVETQSNVEETAGHVQGVTDTTIYVGNTAATTGSFAGVGVPFNAGLEAALLEYNTAGGFDGKNIELKHYDDGFDAAQGMTYTSTLVEDDKVFALVGHFGTNTVAATLDYVKQTGIPTAYIVTGISDLYAEGLSGKDACYFPVQPIYNGEGRMLLARAMADPTNGVGLGAKKIGVLATTDDAGAGMLGGINRQAEEGSVDLVVQEVDASATDYISAVTYLMSQGCDVVIAAMNQAPLATALSSMASIEYNVPVITSYVSASPTTLGEMVDKGHITANRPVYTNAWLDTSTEEGLADYTAFANAMLAWEAANGIDSSDASQTYVLNSYAMAGYVAGATFLHGLNQLSASGEELTWENYIAAMESAPMHVPMGGEISFAGGDRIGITALAFNSISFEKNEIGIYALEPVSPIMSLDDVWAAVE